MHANQLKFLLIQRWGKNRGTISYRLGHTKVAFLMAILNDLFVSQLRLDKILMDDKIGLWKVLPNVRTHNEHV